MSLIDESASWDMFEISHFPLARGEKNCGEGCKWTRRHDMCRALVNSWFTLSEKTSMRSLTDRSTGSRLQGAHRACSPFVSEDFLNLFEYGFCGLWVDERVEGMCDAAA